MLRTVQGLRSHGRPVASARRPAPPSRGSGSHPLPGPALAGRRETMRRCSRRPPRPPLRGQRGEEVSDCPQTGATVTGLGWESSGSCRKRSRRWRCQHTSRLAVREQHVAQAGTQAKRWLSAGIAWPFPSAAELSPGLRCCEEGGGAGWHRDAGDGDLRMPGAAQHPGTLRCPQAAGSGRRHRELRPRGAAGSRRGHAVSVFGSVLFTESQNPRIPAW